MACCGALPVGAAVAAAAGASAQQHHHQQQQQQAALSGAFDRRRERAAHASAAALSYSPASARLSDQPHQAAATPAAFAASPSCAPSSLKAGQRVCCCSGGGSSSTTSSGSSSSGSSSSGFFGARSLLGVPSSGASREGSGGGAASWRPLSVGGGVATGWEAEPIAGAPVACALPNADVDLPPPRCAIATPPQPPSSSASSPAANQAPSPQLPSHSQPAPSTSSAAVSYASNGTSNGAATTAAAVGAAAAATAVAAVEELPKMPPESLTYAPGLVGGITDATCPPGGTPTVDRVAYLRRILTSRVYDVAIESPLELAPKLSARCGNQIFLKREDMQPVFSFKLRGAYNMMASLTPQQLARGVICSSAGNHAQGVALAASRLKCSAVIAMPVTTPEIKWRSVQRLGAEVVLVGDSYDATQAYAKQRALEEGRVFVPPFDDERVIAGQGTVGMEILRQFSHPTCQQEILAPSPPPPSQHQQPTASDSHSSEAANGSAAASGLAAIANGAVAAVAGDGASCGVDACTLHAVFVPVGGGGLIAGIAAYIKTLKPEIRVIGVEPADANAMALSLHHGRRVQLTQCGTFADGVAVRVVGEETFRVCREMVDGVVLVSRDAICAAIKDMFEETRSILEPAGALALAGAKAYCEAYGLQGQSVVAVTSGANMNFDRLRLVAELADVGAKREAVVVTQMPETPGAFKEFAKQVGPSMNITEFKYRTSDPKHASVLYSVGLHQQKDLDAMVQRLDAAGMPTVDLTDNDLAKDHLRHLMGGRTSVANEALFRFVFPERPGALLKFLDMLSPRWNITLFHYRRQGEMGANILVGLQVPLEDKAEFIRSAEALGYEYKDETNNAALRHMFMR